MQKIVLLTILGMAVVTYLPRLLPILALSGRSLPPLLAKWLSCIPAAVLSAMLAPSLLVSKDHLSLSTDNLFLWAAIPTFIVAKWGKSFMGAILTGMGLVALGRIICL
jgi:branched-subunit amino acid transport protein